MNIQNEEWRDIADLGGRYQVSNLGRIKRVAFKSNNGQMFQEVIITPFTWQSRYLRVDLKYGKIRKATYVHKIVAETFIGPRPEGCEIDHINRDYLDNRAINLRYVTKSQNMKNTNKVYTQETKEKLSVSAKKQWEDEEYKQYMGSCVSKALKGRVHVVNKNGETHAIHKEDLDKYIQLGYVRGRKWRSNNEAA